MPSLEVKLIKTHREFFIGLIWLVNCFPYEGSALAFHLPILECILWGRGIADRAVWRGWAELCLDGEIRLCENCDGQSSSSFDFPWKNSSALCGLSTQTKTHLIIYKDFIVY